MNPFEFVNAINYNKTDIIGEDPSTEKSYNSFLVNRSLSYFPDTVAIANEMNRYHHVDNKMQFDFLRNVVRKRKRFSKWNKPETHACLELVKEYYKYSTSKAEAVIDILTSDQLEEMKKVLNKGGKK